MIESLRCRLFRVIVATQLTSLVNKLVRGRIISNDNISRIKLIYFRFLSGRYALLNPFALKTWNKNTKRTLIPFFFKLETSDHLEAIIIIWGPSTSNFSVSFNSPSRRYFRSELIEPSDKRNGLLILISLRRVPRKVVKNL